MNEHGICYRDYQIAARDAAFKAFDSGTEAGLIVMPTGTGKTVLAGMCIEVAKERSKKALFLAHRETLNTQAADTMRAFGFDVAVEMGAQKSLEHEAVLGPVDVVIGSLQSLQDNRLMTHPTDEFGIIIIDECHRALGDSYSKILNWFRGYYLLGITATPKRADERNLGARFHEKVFDYPLREAIRQQWLVPIKTRECPVPIDLRGIRTTGGDFSIGELEERIGPNIEALARAFLREIGPRPFVFFTPDVGSAMTFAQVCDDLGVPTRYVAGTGGKYGMPRKEKIENLAALNEDEIQGVVCCEVLMEGWDMPKIEAVGIGRPTLQQYRYMQMVGRGTRPSKKTGKTDCLIVDFDWMTDHNLKDLCSTVDLFDDGSVDADVFPIAREIAAKSAVDVDPLEAIEEAERIIKTRSRLSIQITGREVQYKALEYDPVGVSKILDVKLNRKYDLDKKGGNPASEAQIRKLSSMGMVNPGELSKWGASKMIDKLMKRQKEGLASVSDVRVLLSAGVSPDIARVMTAANASSAINDLNKLATFTQGNLF